MVNFKLKTIPVIFMTALLSLSSIKCAFCLQDKILCVVGDDLITQKDLDEYLALARLQLSADYPDKKEVQKKIQEVEKDALNQIIEERIILQEAMRQKLRVDEKLVLERTDEISSQYPSSQAFAEALTSEGLTLSDVKRKLNQQILVREAIEENVRSKIFVHPKEVTDYYQEHAAEFSQAESAKVNSIFISLESLDKATGKVQEVLKLLKGGEEFSAVAQKYSDGPSLGMVRRGQLKKEIEEVIFALKKGGFSHPVKTEKGFFIFKLEEIIPAQKRPLSSAKDEVYWAVFQKKFVARFNEWLTTIKKDVYCLIK